MLLETEADLVMVLGIAAAILLFLALAGGIIASIKTFQVRQFQDLLHTSERKVESLERRIFNVLNAVPVALVETDMTGKFTFANRAAHQLLGRKDSELIGLRFHSATWGITYPDGRLIPPDLLPIARTLRGQTVKGFQHLMAHPVTRSKILVSVTSMPIIAPSGEVIGSTSAFIEIENETGEGVGDITGIWRGQWFTTATVPFWGLDLSGKVLDINPAASMALDMSREQSVGQTWAQTFVADKDFQTAVDYLAEVQAPGHGRTEAVRVELKLADGASQSVWLSAWMVATQDGSDKGLTVMALPDLSELPTTLASPEPALLAAGTDDVQQDLADLRQAEQVRADLGIGVWVYDPLSDSIVEDEGMRRLIGRETTGGPTLIADEDQSVADAAFGALMSGERDVLEIDVRAGDAQTPLRWIRLKGKAAIDGEGTRGLSGVAFDITEYKLALEAAQTVVATEGVPEPAPDIEIMPETPLESVEEIEARLRAELDAAHQAALDAAVMAEKVRVEAEQTAITEARIAAAVADARAEIEAAQIEEAQAKEVEILQLAQPETPNQSEIQIQPEAPAVRETSLRDAAQNLVELTRYWTLRAGEPTLISLSSDWHDLTGLMAHEFMADGWLDCVHEDDQTPLLERIKGFMISGTGGQVGYRLRTTGGTFVRMMEYIKPVVEDGVFDGLLGLAFEIEGLVPEPKIETKAEAVVTEIDGLPVLDIDPALLVGAQIVPASTGIDEEEHQQTVAALEAARAQAEDLQVALNAAISAKASLERRAQKLDEALSIAQRYETVGRLTGNVANDFGQMLHVINGALDMMQKQSHNPEHIKRLSEAALVAGKRGERLTRQLQAFTQSDDD